MSDVLILTLRLHDPAEKQDAKKSTSWVVLEVPRSDLKMAKADFVAKYMTAVLADLTQLELT